jgi:AAA domain
MLPPMARLPQLQRLIDRHNYFVIHAPRQVGKTTAMLSLAQQLTASDRYCAAMVSVEVGSPFNNDMQLAENAILGAWQRALRQRLPKELQPPKPEETESGQKIQHFLAQWAAVSPRPIALFIDEIDSLQDQLLISVLRQLRDGYPDRVASPEENRPSGFPISIGLIGMRDVRDYKAASGGSDRLQSASPFNIKVESLTLRNFNAVEVAELYQQHTNDTGQAFTPESIQLVFELTQGQPWLVNALAQQLTDEISPDPQTTITTQMVEVAKEILIRRQDTHLDSLAERLQEERVKAIIEPMFAGLELGNIPNEDIQFVQDLGLCALDPQGGLTIANPIYREVLPRVLMTTPIASLPHISPSWLEENGEINLDRLLQAFLDFWLQHGEALLKSASYPEIAPHLVLMAFLHRVVNGGGTLEREYAIGRDRMDLCLRYGDLILGIELKVWRTGQADPLTKGLQQLEGYLNRLPPSIGWLVIFDRRRRKRSYRRSNAVALEERLQTLPALTPTGLAVTVIRA